MRTISLLYDCYGVSNNNEKINAQDVFILFSEDIHALKSVDSNVKAVMTINGNLSSHFFNVLRFFCDTNHLVLIVGSKELLQLINGNKTLLLSKDQIIVNDSNSTLIIKKDDDHNKFNDIIELNCSSFGICHRPNKIYNVEEGKMIAQSQTFDDLTAKYYKGKIWNYYGMSFRQVTNHFLEDEFSKYLSYLKVYLNVLKDIIVNTNADDCLKKKLKYDLYKYSPFVGYFLNVISYVVYTKSEVLFDRITLEAAKKYNLNMDDSMALKTIEHLSTIISLPQEDRETIISSIGGEHVSNYEVCLYLISGMSDLRRRSNQILQNGR